MADSIKLIATPGSVEVVAAEKGGGKLPTFSFHGYTGAPMQVEGFSHPVIVDLAGVTLAEPITALMNHDEQRILGQGTAKVTPEGIFATGTLMSDGPDAMSVVTLSKNGFKWQASIGASVNRRESLKPGEKALVNGREVTGPMVIARESLVHEISFVRRGADSQTSALVAGKKTAMADDVNNGDELSAAMEPARLEGVRRKAVYAHAAEAARTNPNKADQLEAMARLAVESGQDEESFSIDALRAARPDRILFKPSGAGHIGGGYQGGMMRATSGEREKLEAGLLIRCGKEELAAKVYGEQIVEAARRSRITNLVDLAAAALQLDGRPAFDMPSRDGMIRAGFSTISLPTVLANTANRMLLSSYQEATANWRAFCRISNAENFKTNTDIRMSAIGNLSKVGPQGEIKHGKIGEEGVYTWNVSTYAEMLTISRTDMINDDLRALDTLSPAMGVAAGRTLSDLIFETLLANGGSFFSSGNLNLLEGGSALDVASLGDIVKAMRTQKDSQSIDISITPTTLLVGPTLEMTARTLLRSAEILPTSGAPTGNPVQGIVPNLVVESRLENSRFTGYSATSYYLFGPPSAGAVIVGFLRGQQNPTLELEQAEFNTLGVSMRCVFDFGCALGDPKAAVKATGQS